METSFLAVLDLNMKPRSIVSPREKVYVQARGEILESMRKIKILLANSRPRIMREVMRQLIGRQSDMEVVAEVLDLSALARVVSETVVDVIIIALEDSEALGLVSRLLAEHPSITILAVATRSDAAFIEQAESGRRDIADPSAANILRVLREAIGTHGGLNTSNSLLQPSMEENHDGIRDPGQRQEGHCQCQ